MNHTQEKLRRLVRYRMNFIQNLNPNFSMRKLSKLINVSPSSLCEFLAGKRLFSKNLVASTSKILGVENIEEVELIEAEPFIRYPYLDSIESLCSHPVYQTLIELFQTKDCSADIQWLESRTGFKADQIESALSFLESIGLVVTNQGMPELLVSNVQRVESDTGHIFLKSRHELNLDAAKQVLNDKHTNLKQFSYSTVASSAEKIELAKQKIEDFQNELVEFLSSGEKEEVFEVCFQMFPRTRQIRQAQ